MSGKMWEVTAEHASTCRMDERIYLYYPPGSEQRTGVVFDIVRQLKGVLSDGKYIRIDNLAENDKVQSPANLGLNLSNRTVFLPLFLTKN